MKLETNHSSIIEYVRERGYVSYSTLKLLRDGGTPGQYKQALHFDVGTELHAQWLEGKKPSKLVSDIQALAQIKKMYGALCMDKVAMALKKGAKFEVQFDELVHGVMTHGYIDILTPKKFVGDLKTTVLTTRPAFIKSMDFLQPALYLQAAKRDDFYYVGVSKTNFEVFTFRVSDYPDQMKEANGQLKELLTYIKNKL